MEHAKLGASSASRWFECPGSLKFIDEQPKWLLDQDSEFASEGTLAHDLADKALTSGTDAPESAEFPDMAEAVNVYLKEVRSRETFTSETFVEKKFELGPDMFGTNDAAIVDIGSLYISDYKHGVGVPVEAVDNLQMQYYALGALKKFKAYDIKTVTMTIVQPRCPHPDGPVRSWTVPVRKIVEFGLLLNKKVAIVKGGSTLLKAGKHCRFCPAKAVCPEYKNNIMQGMANQSIADNLELASQVSSWIKGLNKIAWQSMMNGKPIPGMKLVRGVKYRAWTDEAKVREEFKDHGILTEPKLKSPAQLEKIKTIDQKELKKYIFKPKGDLQAALESDKRPAESKVSDQFKELPDTE